MYAVGAGSGVAGGGLDIPNRYIPSAQGFFIEGLDNQPVTFTNAMRMADATSNSLFFKNVNTKSKSTTNSNKLWVNLTSDNGVFNQILVAYVDGATNNDDGSSYDAKRILATNFPATLFTNSENSEKKLAIQSRATSSLNTDDVVKLGFITNIDVATLYTLSLAKFEGDFLTNNPIYLKDNLLNRVHNLTDTNYTFTSEVGEFNNRFEIVFNATVLSNTNFALNSKALKIMELDNDRVQFSTSENLNITNVAIFDLLGRQLYNFKANNQKESFKLSNLSSTVYVAKVELSNGAVITKKAIKK